MLRFYCNMEISVIVFLMMFMKQSTSVHNKAKTTIEPPIETVSESRINFKEILLNHDYVDKTLFIKDFLDDPRIYLITRPKGWGKSLNLDMLKRFLQIEVDDYGTPLATNSHRILFEGGCLDLGGNRTKCLHKTKLMEHHPEIVEKHQGKYPVIYFSFKDLIPEKIKGPRSLKQKVSDGIKNLFNTFPYLKSEYIDKNITFYGCNHETLKKYYEGSIVIDPTLALPRLVTMLKEHFKRQVYVLLDDYDEPLTDSFKALGTAKKYEYRLVRSMVQSICSFMPKQKDFVKGLLMGVMRIPWDNGTEFSNITVQDTMMETRFSEHFGFTRQEVEHLFGTKSNRTDMEEITRWYNGYLIGNKSMYNPSSVIECYRNKGQKAPYWGESESLAWIKKISFTESVKSQLNELIKGNASVDVVLSNKVDFMGTERKTEIYTVLHFCGFLKAIPAQIGSFNVSVTIANEESRKLAANILGF